MILEDATFIIYAAKFYDNPHCHSLDEFENDLKRFNYLKKLFNRFKKTGELKERLIMNHMIILYNCFGQETTAMLLFKLGDHKECLVPFMRFLSYLPEIVKVGKTYININNIIEDKIIKDRLNSI